jgi:hypothetical protein
MNMKIYKSLLTLLILICFTGVLYAKEKDNYIYIQQYNKITGKLTPDQFAILVKASENYMSIMEAQNNDRVSIIVLEEPSKISDNKYQTKIKIIWKNEKGEEINFVTSIMYLTITNNKEDLPEWRITYRNVAEYCVPILLIVIFIITL